MARLYLIRHPHTRPDPAVPASQWGLSETGEAQVRALVNAPFWRQVVAVYTSTHPKTKVVGEVVHQVYGLPVYEDAGLDEAAREGWLEPDEFQAAQRAFFTITDRPPVSGWESADAARAFRGGGGRDRCPALARRLAGDRHACVRADAVSGACAG